MALVRACLLAAVATLNLMAQVYSPQVLLRDQPDSTDLCRLAEGICRQAGAHTPRERAEAIWRYFLTDGRFVKPGFWYHIAGWAYEEPAGEVLDPLKLLNSYGFGLCYQVAPVLEAVWKAGGFEDARVWFLTGHTVAEVYFDGGYHYFDADMMGYNTTGAGPAGKSPVASVHQLELDPSIITGKLTGPRRIDAVRASAPWYPADVAAGAIADLASLFATTKDNRLFPFERAPSGHNMSFTLRPGERLVRYFRPEREQLYYLPYQWTGRDWEEFPRESAEYAIRTNDGPASQKDGRRWATGAVEYRPAISPDASSVYEVRSPYVIIDAELQLRLKLTSAEQFVTVSTSTDDGRTWIPAGTLRGPHRGPWRVEPAVVTRSLHGRRTHVSGSYGYLVKLERSPRATVEDLLLATRVQLNPRTLPELQAGHNELVYSAQAPGLRRELSLDPAKLREAAQTVSNARFITNGAQGFWLSAGAGHAEMVFRLTGEDGATVTGFDAGGRFLDLGSGLAPDKFTAEVRPVEAVTARNPAGSIAWSASPSGPFKTIWEFTANPTWKDGRKEVRTLLWPEVDRHVTVPPARQIYVRYRFDGLALDQVRLARETQPVAGNSPLEVSHLWEENGVSRRFTRTIPAGAMESRYAIDLPAGVRIRNQAIVFECKQTVR